jgi:hypothetical protein
MHFGLRYVAHIVQADLRHDILSTYLIDELPFKLQFFRSQRLPRAGYTPCAVLTRCRPQAYWASSATRRQGLKDLGVNFFCGYSVTLPSLLTLINAIFYEIIPENTWAFPAKK